MTNHWHIHIHKELKAPLWALAKRHELGLVETMEAMLKFALQRPDLLADHLDQTKENGS